MFAISAIDRRSRTVSRDASAPSFDEVGNDLAHSLFELSSVQRLLRGEPGTFHDSLGEIMLGDLDVQADQAGFLPTHIAASAGVSGICWRSLEHRNYDF
jgi:hypothetical protein